ncbi:hypothetical protein HN014_15835 [Aquimarina sp. TRL1]|uniref:hypothetical protein n=1 Tax=Aquimarina sp. (strain TRL1) TaxID=2736252 RepID=UPI0015888AD4|nr:hypothetical protein [Aquimarina sp. TRL1]QKX06319.1 hypothetical protein HN014_15835 [Aquimarina sp. TRL1]
MKIRYPEKNGRKEDLKFTNSFGKYLINHFNTWHGGIHIEKANTPIQAIADGRIIAYRFMDDYEELPKTEYTTDGSTTTKSENPDQKELNNYKYSNCFVLLQHDLLLQKEVKVNEGTTQETSELEKKYITFYSLYNHLMPINPLEGDKFLEAPELFSKEETVVTSNEGYIYKVQGLNARTLNKQGKISSVKLIIPFGEKVNIVKDEDGKEIKKGAYTKVTYTDDQGTTYKDIYIHTSTKYVKKIGDNKYEIITYKEDTKKWEGDSPKGARVRHATKTRAVIKDIIPHGEKVIIKEKKEDWYVIEGYEGYSHKTNFNVKKVFDPTKIEKNKIVACDIPIEAGQKVGYTGSLQGELSNWYYAAQVDVFMAEGTKAFLKNEFGAGKDKKHFTILPKGTLLQKSITIQVNLPEKLEVKVTDIKGVYANIKEAKKKITATVKKSLLGTYKDPAGSNNAYYTIPSDKFDTINKTYFDNQLPSHKTPLYWVSRAKKDGTNISKSQENELLKNKEYIAHRKLQYRPKNNPKTYWVKLKDLFPVTEIKTKEKVVKQLVPLGVKTGSIIEYFMKEDCRFEEKTIQIEYIDTHPAQKGDHTTLNKAITTAYIATPEQETDIDETLPKDVIVDLRNTKKVSQDTNTEWIQVHCSYASGSKRETKKGWIENKNFDTFSAYNWQKFGFTPLDGGDEYMYDIKDLREATDTESEFIKKLWKTISSTKDEVLCFFEIEAAYSTLETQLEIAKMVCKHKLEWAYSPQEIADEVTSFYDYIISKEEDEVKTFLEKLKNQKLDGIKGQVEKMMFWQKAAKLTYSPPPSPPKENTPKKRDFGITEEDRKELSSPVPTTTTNSTVETKKEKEVEIPKRTFPTTENVYHFHPIAFVNQMKLIFGEQTGKCSCNRDLTVEEFTDIFTRLRRSEKLGNDILNHDNCNISNNEKTFERLTEEFNKTTRKYGINHCVQKIHFIAQLYWESARFTTGLEYANGNNYNPGNHTEAKKNGNTQIGDGPKYKGRGFMQLTWRNSQIKYLKYAAKNIEGVLKGKSETELELRSNNYEKFISNDLVYAMDSAGWFWSKYKKVSFSKKSSKQKYADIYGKSLNEVALEVDKYQNLISVFVNGGGNGKKEREKYYKILKRIFRYDTKCINNKYSQANTIDNNSTTPWIEIAKMEIGVEEIYGIDYNDPRILEYHKTAGYTKKLMGREITDDYIKSKKIFDPWCGSFAYWCYSKSGIANENLNDTGYNAFSWKNWGIAPDKFEPCYGALAICDYSHVAFVIGKKGDKIVLLGGNQTGGDKSSNGMVCYSAIDKSKIIGYRYPKNYKISDINYDLKEISTDAKGDNHSTSR